MGRWIALVFIGWLAVVALAACGGSENDTPEAPTPRPAQDSASPTATAMEPSATETQPPTPTFAPTFTATATATPEPTPTIEPTPIPILQQGSGNASVPLQLTAGLTVFTMHHYGEARFVARLIDASGEGRGPIVTDSGPYQGSRAIAVRESGSYTLEISADGSWDLEVQHPIPEDSIIMEPPVELTGTGAQAVYFIKAEPGLHTVRLTHNGEREFIVSVMNSNARAFDRVIDATGEFSGRAAVSVRNEPFDYLIFDIRADGDWTLAFE
jgi:hypothetical protein